ncbi:MAG: hypothetical protein GF353_09095 [Candidatus Lokiarchaeota archaeon]|nr:hypothetical protein [Candidatus Lokiarchaeota archaeon]
MELKYKILCLLGVSVILIYCLMTFISVSLFPSSFSPVDNWLSDLGNSSYNPNGAIFYNLGCILTGIALFPFFGSMVVWYRENLWHKILALIFNVKFNKLISIYGYIVAFINLLFVFISSIPLLEWFTVFSALAFVGLIVFNTYSNFL